MIKNNTFWVIIGSLLFSSSLYAFQPYIGGAIGVQASMHDAHVRDLTDTYNPGLNKVSAILGLVLGVQHAWSSKWVTGIELEGFLGQNRTNFDQNTESGNVQPVQLSVERSSMISLGIKIGYQLQTVMPYIRLGVEGSSFQIKMQGASTTPSQRIEGSKSFIRIAPCPGIGVDFKLNKNLVMYMDARYAFYVTRTAHFQSQVGGKGRVMLKPRTALVLVGVKWFF